MEEARSEAGEAFSVGAHAEIAGEDDHWPRSTRHAGGEKACGTAGLLVVDADIGDAAAVGDVGHHRDHWRAGFGQRRDGVAHLRMLFRVKR